jgi:hypothetical protein
MKTAEPALAAAVAQWLAKAATSDAREDEAYGVDRRGDELPDWVMNKQQRLEKIRAAKAVLEADAQDDAGAKKRKADHHADCPRRGRPGTHPPGTPHDRAPRNFTDPDSRIMKAQDGFIQGYNAQAAVDAAHQVIVSQGLTNQASDAHPLEPMLAHIRRNTGRQARELSADAGYGSEHNLKALVRRHVRGYVATGRQQHGEASAVGIRKTVPRTRVHAMKIRLKRAGIAVAIVCESRWSNPCLARSNRLVASGSSCCGACRRSPVSGVWSAVPTMC